MKVNENIRAIMRKKGIMQNVLAEKIGVSSATVSSYLRNDDIRLSTLERIANALDVSIVDFFKEPEVSDDTEKEFPALTVDGYVCVNGYISRITTPDELIAVTKQVVALRAQMSRD